MLDSYDILNNGKCPFCQGEVVLQQHTIEYEGYTGLYDHCFCENKCIKVMRIKDKMDWVLFRIPLNLPKISCLEVDIRREMMQREDYIRCRTTLGSQDGFDIPHFDIFSYSLDELRNKVKNYLIFL